MTPDTSPEPVPTWKHVLAFILDFVLALFVFGGLIAALTGAWTSSGFELTGLPALVAFALIILYFVVGNRLGGTVFKRLFRIPVARRRAARQPPTDGNGSPPPSSRQSH